MKFRIKGPEALTLKGVTRDAIIVEGRTPLIAQIGELQVRIWIEVVQVLAQNVSFDTTYIAKLVRRIISTKRKIVSEHSAPVTTREHTEAWGHLHCRMKCL